MARFPDHPRFGPKGGAIGQNSHVAPSLGHANFLETATLPSIEDIAMGAIPGLPKVQFHWPLVDFEVGDDFMQWFWKADAGQLEPFLCSLRKRWSCSMGTVA